ncbi:MAG TPA: RHS repeat-associated core domain-containing protein [Verrucomicrobiae bacterium]
MSQIVFKQNTTTRLTTSKVYDFLNRLTSIASATNSSSVPSVSFGYGYNNANQRTRCSLANGSFWIYEYDPLGQVKSGKKFWPDWTPVAGQQFEYAHDDIGNRKSTRAGGDENGGTLRSANYTANSLNQYSSRDVPGAVDVIGLELATNTVQVNGTTPYRKGEYFRKEVTVSNGSVPVWQSVSVTAPNETTVTGNVFVPKNQESFTYDLDGNLTSDGRWNYTWDAENRLVRMVANTAVGPQNRIDFSYDWKSRRITKRVWPNTEGTGTLTSDVRFAYDDWNLVATLNATNNSVIQAFVWGIDLSGTPQGAGGVGGLIGLNDSANGFYFAAFDGNGNVAGFLKGADGSVPTKYEYGPFGELLRMTSPMAKANPFRFSTKYFDEEADLAYYGYRSYQPVTGRWLSRDPLEEAGGAGLYSFVLNHPLLAIDKLGLTATDEQRCCVCWMYKQLGHNENAVRDQLSKKLLISTTHSYSVQPVMDDFITMGKTGGTVGFALLARALCGPPTKVRTINDPNDHKFSAEWEPASQQLALNLAYASEDDHHYEWLPYTLHEFLGDSQQSGAITIAHELGHAYVDLDDPFNVYLVENPVRRAMHVQRRDRYSYYSQDAPYRRGNHTGLIWSGTILGYIQKEVSESEWQRRYTEAAKAVADLIKDWGGSGCDSFF